MSAGPYCVIADLTSKADAAFVLECADDDNSGAPLDATETQYVQDRIAEASDMIFAKLGFLYSDAALAASSYISRCCIVTACYLLSKRRANPPKFKEEFDWWFGAGGELDQIEVGKKRIPDAVPLATPVPLQSNQGYVGGQPNGNPAVTDYSSDPQNQVRRHRINTDFLGPGPWGI